MAILKSTELVEPLLPKPNKFVYESMITCTDKEALNNSTVYGIEVDNKLNTISDSYKVSFSLFSLPGKHYLFVNNAEKEVTAGCPFITALTDEHKEPTVEDFKFKVDEIGLHVVAGRFGYKTIYFATKKDDSFEVEKLINKSNNKILTLETVYV